MKRLLAALVAGMLAGCVSVAKIESGERAVGERMSITIDGQWNHLNAPGLGPAQTVQLASHGSQSDHTPFWMANKHLVVAFCTAYAICGVMGLIWYYRKGASSALRHPVLDVVGRQQSPARVLGLGLRISLVIA